MSLALSVAVGSGRSARIRRFPYAAGSPRVAGCARNRVLRRDVGCIGNRYGVVLLRGKYVSACWFRCGYGALSAGVPPAVPGFFHLFFRRGRCRDDGGRRSAVRPCGLCPLSARRDSRRAGMVGRQTSGDRSAGRIHGADAFGVCRL